MKRLLRSIGVSLGLLGVLICVAAAVVIWFTGFRLTQANEQVFDAIERSLAATRDRVKAAQERVQDSKITMEDVSQGVEQWLRREASARVASRVEGEVQDKAERLASGLRQADAWLEVSTVSLQGVQKALELAGTLGISANAASLNASSEKLGDIRNQLKHATETVDAIRERMAKNSAGETTDERIRRVAQLTLRVLATLGQVDSNLGQLADRLAVTQTRGQDLKRQIRTYIVAAQMCACLLIAWMAAGQVSLFRQSRRP